MQVVTVETVGCVEPSRMPCAMMATVCYHSTYNRPKNVFPFLFIFTAPAYARAVLGVVILSVCPSVCLSHACIVTKLNDALQIF